MHRDYVFFDSLCVQVTGANNGQIVTIWRLKAVSFRLQVSLSLEKVQLSILKDDFWDLCRRLLLLAVVIAIGSLHCCFYPWHLSPSSHEEALGLRWPFGRVERKVSLQSSQTCWQYYLHIVHLGILVSGGAEPDDQSLSGVLLQEWIAIYGTGM